MTIQTTAWTGGSTPGPYNALPHRERYLVSELFREQAQAYIARWGALELSYARIFWSQARYDAHATVRD